MIVLENIQKIGIVEPMNLGDLLWSVPLFRALRYAWPQAEIVLIADAYVAPFYERFHHYLDRMILFDADIEWSSEQELLPFIENIKSERFDLILKLYFWLGIKPEICFWDEHYQSKVQKKHDTSDTSSSSDGHGVDEHVFWAAHQRSIRLACALGARYTAGIAETSADRPASFIGVPHTQNQHVVETLLSVAQALGIPSRGRHLEFPLTQIDHQEAGSLLTSLGISSERPLVGIHPGSSVNFRRWAPERFAQVADFLVEEYDANILITGVASERALMAQVMDCMCHTDRAVDVSGVNLGTLAALIDKMTLLVCNSTGPLHLAVARQCPSIGVFGLESEAIQWRGRDTTLHCALVAPGGGVGMRHVEAMRMVSVEQAISAAQRLLKQKRTTQE
jgi:ADP-heptose:LPS heptosyltransferase